MSFKLPISGFSGNVALRRIEIAFILKIISFEDYLNLEVALDS